ncbi:MAG: response regulator [Myxococcaceae bacterium]|nr:response regulator [Myxococcaceae bacterium]
MLLAHADETRRGALAWELGTGGCSVVEVEDGCELLDYLDQHGPWVPLPRPDVIVAELDMEGCSGFEAICAMRRAGDLTPVIFINVHQAPTAAIAATHLPNCRVLHGDIEGGLLRAAVEEALRRQAH